MIERTLLIEKDRLARSFLRGRDTYEHQAVVQQLVNQRLLRHLKELGGPRYSRILEIGSCTGMLSRLIFEAFRPELFVLNDLVPEFYQSVRKKLGNEHSGTITPLFGDIEHLELPEDLDLVVSSSTFQWLEHSATFFGKVARALSKGGVFGFSMFGEETYHELKELTGVGLNYPTFTEVCDSVSREHTIVYAEIDRDLLNFNHPREVLKHIQATGVSGVGGFRWTPRRYEQFVDDYFNRFGSGNGVVLSYVSYFIIAQKKG